MSTRLISEEEKRKQNVANECYCIDALSLHNRGRFLVLRKPLLVRFFLMWVLFQPPPQALLFSHGRGERETRVTGDEPQGTMERVQTAGEAPARSCVVFFGRKQPPHTQDAEKQFYSPTWQRELV